MNRIPPAIKKIIICILYIPALGHIIRMAHVNATIQYKTIDALLLAAVALLIFNGCFHFFCC